MTPVEEPVCPLFEEAAGALALAHEAGACLSATGRYVAGQDT